MNVIAREAIAATLKLRSIWVVGQDRGDKAVKADDIEKERIVGQPGEE